MLTGKGVTAWRHALKQLAPTAPITPAAGAPRPSMPAHIAAELINALAAVALAGT